MTASNIERFDEITGLVLGKLYENFPVPIYLLVKNFVDDGYKMNEALGLKQSPRMESFSLPASVGSPVPAIFSMRNAFTTKASVAQC